MDSQVQRGEMVDSEAVPVDIKEEIDIDDSVYWNVKREIMSDIDQQKPEQQVPPSSGAGGSLVEKGIQEKQTERTGYLECVKKEQEHGERYEEEEEDVDEPDQCKASCSKAIGQFQIDENKEMICTIKEEDTFQEEIVPIPFVKLLLEGECQRALLKRDGDTVKQEPSCWSSSADREGTSDSAAQRTEDQDMYSQCDVSTSTSEAEIMDCDYYKEEEEEEEETFSQSSTLNTHMRTHTDDRPYHCTVCTKTFSRSSHLNTHMRTHTDERPYQCTVCTKTFSQSSTLNTHMRTHTDERPYQCTVCTKTFSQSSSLNTHMRTHTYERPYQCTVCTKTFSRSSNLNTHMRTHTDERPYQCTVCTKTFSQSSNLNTHMRTHTDERRL